MAILASADFPGHFASLQLAVHFPQRDEDASEGEIQRHV
jgi:hypothetical protein